MYHCYHCAIHKVIESFHVTFIESFETSQTPLLPGIIVFNPSSPDPSLNNTLSLSSSVVPLSSSTSVLSLSPLFSSIISLSLPILSSSIISLSSPILSLSIMSLSPSVISSSSSLIFSSSTSTLPSSSSSSADPVIPSIALKPASLTVSSLCCSTRNHISSDHLAEAEDIFKLTSVKCTVQESIDSAAHLEAQCDSHQPTCNLAAALISEALSAILEGPVNPAYLKDLNTLHEAMVSPYAEQWQAALQKEFTSIKALGVYKLIFHHAVSAGHHVMQGHLVFYTKFDQYSQPTCHKVYWVCKGYEAICGQDYVQMTSLTMHMEAFWFLLHLAVSLNWELHQIDIKTAFLYGLLNPDEVCYMEQLKGFEEVDKENWI